ncbi:MAG: hypothetical protein ACHQ6T_11345 [Myxococcota bacterium]
MGSYAEALLDFYRGEVLGEAVYSGMFAAARSEAERLKWATLLQLETETKAWLRAPMLASGASIAEPAADRAQGAAVAEQLKSLPWEVQVKGLRDAIPGDYIPRYQAYAAAARARGARDEESVCLYMVEHERAQHEFALRELAGASAERSLEPVVKLLRYPLER